MAIGDTSTVDLLMVRHRHWGVRGISEKRRTWGLDGVELLMALEDEFEIEIPDEESAKIRTVGELYDVIVSHLDKPSTW